MDKSVCHCINKEPLNGSVYQTIEEMDFERGIWFPALTGDVERIKKLLNSGHSPNDEDKSGYMALHYAARSGHTEICSILLAAGALVNSVTRSLGSTPLHRAALSGKFEVVKLLLNHHADPDIKDSEGRTSLHRAVEGGEPRVVSHLIEHFPHLASVMDNSGKTPREAAISKPSIFNFFDKE